MLNYAEINSALMISSARLRIELMALTHASWSCAFKHSLAIFLRHLHYKQIELGSCLSVDVSEIAVQLAAENKVGIDHWTMLSKVLLVLSAPDTDGVDFFFRNDQTRKIIISVQFIPKSIAVVPSGFEVRWIGQRRYAIIVGIMMNMAKKAEVN